MTRLIKRCGVFLVSLTLTAVASDSLLAAPKSISQGRAETITASISGCPQGRTSGLGQITAQDGKVFMVPADVQYLPENMASDLHNGCAGVRPGSLGDVDLNKVPLKTIDADGDIVTGLLFSDNYFEFFINGHLIGVDAIPFTPFNASVVRFRVKRPYVIAAKLVDWEENLGLGTEQNRGTRYHAGDGGFVASFSDGTVTDKSWKAYPYYMSPVQSLSRAEALDDVSRDTSGLPSDHIDCAENCYAVHYPVPDDWAAAGFKSGQWPFASEFSNRTVGVNNKPAYMNFEDQFIAKGAKFIWSPNLVTDNLVLVRKIVD